MADDIIDVANDRIFGFQVHHIIPIALWENPGLADVLGLLPIAQESRGNKIGLLITDEKVQALASAPTATTDAMLASGMGLGSGTMVRTPATAAS